nr:MAG TPA: hypothetical protein [Caudoviricetes sp.]
MNGRILHGILQQDVQRFPKDAGTVMPRKWPED